MSDRKITIKSGNEEFTLEVTEEEYRNYFRPWWSQRKREQRNREAMEQNGYTEESYETWRDVPMEEITKGSPLLQKGKLAELGLGFSGASGGSAWRRTGRGGAGGSAAG